MQLTQQMDRSITIPLVDDDCVLRHVLVGNDAILLTWDTYLTDDRGQTCIGYALFVGDDEDPLFVGDEFCGSPMHADDSDETLLALMSFLCLRPGDTDREYFESHTPAQLEWAESSECEQLQCDLDRESMHVDSEGRLHNGYDDSLVFMDVE